MNTQTREHWPSLIGAIAAMVGAALYLVTLPVVMGNFADELALDEAQLGILMGVFQGGFTLATISGYWWIRRFNWSRSMMAAGVVGALGMLGPLLAQNYSVLAVGHVLAGIASGFAYGIAFTLLCDSANPARALALSYGAQALVGFAVSMMMPTGEGSYSSTLMILALGLAICIPAASLIKGRENQRETAVCSDNTGAALPRYLVFAALAVVFIAYLSEVSGVTFMSEIGMEKGFDRELGQQAASWSQLTSFLGSALAAWVGVRFGRIAPMCFGIAGSLTAMALFGFGDTSTAYMVASLLLLFAFGFGAPYRVALVADADTEGRYSTWAVSAQTIAGTIGPAMSGMLMTGSSYAVTYMLWSVCFALGLVIFIWVSRRVPLKKGEMPIM